MRGFLIVVGLIFCMLPVDVLGMIVTDSTALDIVHNLGFFADDAVGLDQTYLIRGRSFDWFERPDAHVCRLGSGVRGLGGPQGGSWGFPWTPIIVNHRKNYQNDGSGCSLGVLAGSLGSFGDPLGVLGESRGRPWCLWGALGFF